MAIQKIKSLFYESPKPVIIKVVEPNIEKDSSLKKNISSIINEGVMFGSGPKLYGTGQSKVDQSLGAGGGYAGGITKNRKSGETQFGIVEEEDDMNIDATAEKMKEKTPEDTPEAPVEDTPSEETKDAPIEDSTSDAPKEDTTPEIPPTPEETPEQKVTKMFADTGDVDTDYDLTNENNIRLEKYKFTNAGLDLSKLIPEDDQKSGISSKDVMNLLTPSQRDVLKDKNRELRKTYPLMDKREKNIIIHNSNVSIYNTKDGENVEISTDMKKQAYDKINTYLETNFGKNWQDKTKAIDFLRTIKINFSEMPAIRANLIDAISMMSEDGENYKIPLDKVNVLVPSIVQEFIKTNKEDPTFSRSNIFRTITSAYNQEAGTKGQIYVIFNSENLGKSKDGSDKEEKPIEEPSSKEIPTEATPSSDEVSPEGEEVDMSDVLENAVEPLPAG